MPNRRPLTRAEKAHGRRLMAAVGVPADAIRETRTRLYWVDPATGEDAPGLAASELRACLDDPDALELLGEPARITVREGVVKLGDDGIHGDAFFSELRGQLAAAQIVAET